MATETGDRSNPSVAPKPSYARETVSVLRLSEEVLLPTFVVAGGDAGGIAAASNANREDPVKGGIQSLADLVSVASEECCRERDIDLRTGHEVVDGRR